MNGRVYIYIYAIPRSTFVKRAALLVIDPSIDVTRLPPSTSPKRVEARFQSGGAWLSGIATRHRHAIVADKIMSSGGTCVLPILVGLDTSESLPQSHIPFQV